jgi:Zn-dependent metalloprotease
MTAHPLKQRIEQLGFNPASRVSKTLHRRDDVELSANGEAHFPEAIDAHYAATMTYDFLRDVLARNSIDGRGERLIVTVGSTARHQGGTGATRW